MWGIKYKLPMLNMPIIGYRVLEYYYLVESRTAHVFVHYWHNLKQS